MLLHVLGQVGLLRVGFPTVRTDVSLQVFGLLVLRDVIQEGGLVMKTFIAGVTLVGFVRLVTPRVRLQVGQLGEGLGATWKRKTGIRKGLAGSDWRARVLLTPDLKFNWSGVRVAEECLSRGLAATSPTNISFSRAAFYKLTV